MLSLRDLFFLAKYPNIFSTSWQVTFPRSLITLIAFALDFQWILCSLFGLCCPNQHLECCAPTRGMRSRSHSIPLMGYILYYSFLLHHFLSRKVLNSNMNISSASFTATLKLTRTFNMVNSTKLEEVTPNWLSSLSLQPKMTGHFRVTPGNT